MAVSVDEAKCPYCGVKLDPPPQRARKCSDCGEKFFVRKSLRDGNRYIYTAGDIRQEEETIEAERSLNEAERGRERLLKQNGWREGRDGKLHPPATPDEVERRLRNELLRMRDEGALGFKGVKVCLANNPDMCPTDCAVRKIKSMSLSRALEDMPIPRLCESRDGYCRCFWTSVYEDPDTMVDRMRKWVDDPSSDQEMELWHQKQQRGRKTKTPESAGCLFALFLLFIPWP